MLQGRCDTKRYCQQGTSAFKRHKAEPEAKECSAMKRLFDIRNGETCSCRISTIMLLSSFI